MSKFIDAIQAISTGRKFAPFPALSVKLTDRESSTFDLMKEYEFTVQWTVLAKCLKEDFPLMMGNIRRQLTREVYGDFREKMLHLERAVYESDRDKVAAIIRELLMETD